MSTAVRAVVPSVALPAIVVTAPDLERLRSVIDQHDTPAAESLDAELHRAQIVEPDDVPGDVVTMNSEVVYEDTTLGTRRTVRLVFPNAADAGAGRVSVLAPVGSALLGLRVGQEIDWVMPTGRHRIRVVEVRR